MTTRERLQHALEVLHTLRTFEMTSATATLYERSLNMLYEDIRESLREVEQRHA